MAEGFICRRGGGAKLPTSISAGTVPVFCAFGAAEQSTAVSYATIAGRGIQARIAGTYRFAFDVHNKSGYNNYARLIYNNAAAVAGSEIYTGYSPSGPQLMIIDVYVNAGDTVRLQMTSVNATSASAGVNKFFVVSIAAPSMQAEFQKAVIAI